MSRKLMFLLVCLVGFTSVLFGDDGSQGLQSLNNAGATAQTTVVKAVEGWRWLLGIVPLGVAGFLAFKMKEYLEQKDEQSGGQSEPKFSRYGKIIAAFIGGIVITYIVFGVLGTVFANKGFGDMWELLVVDFWKQIFGGANP